MSQIKHPLTEDTAKEVWEEKEQLPKVLKTTHENAFKSVSKDEFNPKTYFALNDLDSNGLLDLEEVSELFSILHLFLPGPKTSTQGT